MEIAKNINPITANAIETTRANPMIGNDLKVSSTQRPTAVNSSRDLAM